MEETSTSVETKSVKTNKSKLPYIIGGIIVVLIALGAVMFFRVRLLQSQLELANGYLANEQYDEAILTYQRALKIYPTSADAYLGIAEATIGKGELTEAISILDEGIQKSHSANLEASRDKIMDQVFATYVLDEYLINILQDETAQLSVIHRSEDMNFDVTWSSADESIATVDDTGFIHAIKNGTTSIIATVGNDVWGYRDIDATLIVGLMVTYLQEQGCDYVTDATGLKAPAFVYQADSEGMRKYDGTLEVEQLDATYTLTKCTVTDPDADGNVTYDVEYQITIPTKFGILAGSVEAKKEWYYNWKSIPMFLCDDYTGLIFAEQNLFGEEGIAYESEVNWNNMSFKIDGAANDEWVNDQEWEVTYSPITTITWAEAPVIDTYKLSITVPKEYQGLVLALDKNGITDYTDPADDEMDDGMNYKDTFFFDPLEDGSVRKADDFYIVRLAEFATPK